MKKNVIINGHPNAESFCYALAESYHKGALENGHQSELIHLSKLRFNPVLQYGYQKRTPLEPDLEAAWELIQQAEHVTFVYPNWWGTYPALLKGFIDRLFLPGMAFERKSGLGLPEKLLKGKTARVLVTMDSPGFYYKWFTHMPGHHSMRHSVLNFVGIKPVRFSNFYGVKESSAKQREKWLQKAYLLGTKLN